jgi:flagellar basal-body rod modification protein FlgD
VTATDAEGTNITTTAKGRIDGVVTKVTNESGVNMVWIGDTKVPLDSVIGVTNPPTTTT